MKDDLLRAAARLQAAAALPVNSADDTLPAAVRGVCTAVNEFCRRVEPAPLADWQQKLIDEHEQKMSKAKK
jgi:hypothetical protein